MIGNEVCNDETNNEDCNYDGGDCCESCVAMEECTECACIKEIIDSTGSRVCTNSQGKFLTMSTEFDENFSKWS